MDAIFPLMPPMDQEGWKNSGDQQYSWVILRGNTMRNLLALIGLAAIFFVVAGYFKGWFSINGNDIELHTEKAREDIQKGLNEGLKRVSQNPGSPSGDPSKP